MGLNESDITKYWKNLNWFSVLFFPLSLIYCLFIKIRQYCYQLQYCKSSSVAVPLIIIGNITVGGNGKTPLIIHLLQEFKRRGYKPGVVSRGYGAINTELKKGKTLAINLSADVKNYGDEPWMIAKKTNCPVVVGKKRSAAVEHLIKEFDCNIVLSDDGMQHYAMGRDIEICVVDSSKLFGNNLCLPAGPLREPRSRLKLVDYIVYHDTASLKQGSIFVEDMLPDRKPIDRISMHLDFEQIYLLDSFLSVTGSNKAINIVEFNNKTVHAVAGIASPQRFFAQLRSHGVKVIEHAFADHYQFSRNDLQFDDNFPVLMTEKDAVKCYCFGLSNCYYISVKASLSFDLVGSIIAKLSR
jgi:tetraacyldisaccharide 4'-kinase